MKNKHITRKEYENSYNNYKDYLFYIANEEMYKQIKNLQQRIDKAVELLNEPQFELDNIPCNYENDIEKLRNILRGDE